MTLPTMTPDEAVETFRKVGFLANSLSSPDLVHLFGGTGIEDHGGYENAFRILAHGERMEGTLTTVLRRMSFEGTLREIVGALLNEYVKLTFVERRCRSCGTGRILCTAKPGRKTKFHYRELDVPASLYIGTCTDCGNEWFDDLEAYAFDFAMAAVLDKVTTGGASPGFAPSSAGGTSGETPPPSG